ncbi:calmodulin-binding transcription activator 1 isoform X1 [Iris pallida]|uniref:Calmodulin-binding transcription activator 1 isoform X1 n=1 Tax=Iris pallida TaxID=29817 RepID=A0AAX6GZ04_IRIPA|nr:calmodulin-binding transcription activator 1 isoform X1 [Iris pallida]
MLLFFYSRFKYTNLGRFRSSYFSCNHQVFISQEYFHMLAAETCEGTSVNKQDLRSLKLTMEYIKALPVSYSHV